MRSSLHPFFSSRLGRRTLFAAVLGATTAASVASCSSNDSRPTGAPSDLGAGAMGGYSPVTGGSSGGGTKGGAGNGTAGKTGGGGTAGHGGANAGGASGSGTSGSSGSGGSGGSSGTAGAGGGVGAASGSGGASGSGTGGAAGGSAGSVSTGGTAGSGAGGSGIAGTTGAGNGGAPGPGGSAGAGATGGMTTGGAAGTASGGKAGTGGGGAGGNGGFAGIPEMIGGTGGAPSMWGCNSDLAYWASGASVMFPPSTPSGVASAFTEVSAGVNPISLVLHKTGSGVTGAVSATVLGGNSKDVFPPGKAPVLVPTVVPFTNMSQLTSTQPQDVGYLHFVDSQGPVYVAISHVIWTATEGSSCSDVDVVADADIAGAALSTVLHLSSGNKTIGELSGFMPPDGGFMTCDGGISVPGQCEMDSVSIRITFHGAPMSFDFTTL